MSEKLYLRVKRRWCPPSAEKSGSNCQDACPMYPVPETQWSRMWLGHNVPLLTSQCFLVCFIFDTQGQVCLDYLAAIEWHLIVLARYQCTVTPVIHAYVYNVHGVTIGYESGWDKQNRRVSLPGRFAQWGSPGKIARQVSPDSGKFYKELKYYVGIIFVINIELIECW